MDENEELFDYYIDDEILSSLKTEFSIDTLVENIIEKSESKESNYAEDWGINLIKKTIELSKNPKDRTGQIIEEVANKTGHLFPHIPQRYLEIAYLVIRPKDKWEITSSTLYNFTHTIYRCNIYKKLGNANENMANNLVCKNICLKLLQTLFNDLGIKIELKMTALMPKDGNCSFEVYYKEKLD